MRTFALKSGIWLTAFGVYTGMLVVLGLGSQRLEDAGYEYNFLLLYWGGFVTVPAVLTLVLNRWGLMLLPALAVAPIGVLYPDAAAYTAMFGILGFLASLLALGLRHYVMRTVKGRA